MEQAHHETTAQQPGAVSMRFNPMVRQLATCMWHLCRHFHTSATQPPSDGCLLALSFHTVKSHS